MTDNYMPETLEELTGFISEKIENKHTYQSSADAMWQAALAAFNFVASELGTSGWQASHAELMFLAKSRRIDGPFALIRAHDMLYPQSNILNTVDQYSEDWMPWVIQECKKKLASEDRKYVADSVWEHWEAIVEFEDDYPKLKTE